MQECIIYILLLNCNVLPGTMESWLQKLCTSELNVMAKCCPCCGSALQHWTGSPVRGASQPNVYGCDEVDYIWPRLPSVYFEWSILTSNLSIFHEVSSFGKKNVETGKNLQGQSTFQKWGMSMNIQCHGFIICTGSFPFIIFKGAICLNEDWKGKPCEIFAMRS